LYRAKRYETSAETAATESVTAGRAMAEGLMTLLNDSNRISTPDTETTMDTTRNAMVSAL
jgi:hypothetical protein